jgi:hypothetical protein
MLFKFVANKKRKVLKSVFEIERSNIAKLWRYKSSGRAVSLRLIFLYWKLFGVN